MFSAEERLEVARDCLDLFVKEMNSHPFQTWDKLSSKEQQTLFIICKKVVNENDLQTDSRTFLKKVTLPPISDGTRVITTQCNPDINDWSEEALATRQWGVLGSVIKHHDSHGLCYAILHADGTTGYYDPTEFRALG